MIGSTQKPPMGSTQKPPTDEHGILGRFVNRNFVHTCTFLRVHLRNPDLAQVPRRDILQRFYAEACRSMMKVAG